MIKYITKCKCKQPSQQRNQRLWAFFFRMQD